MFGWYLYHHSSNVVHFQVSTDAKPVVGLRLYLEGKKSNRLALHLQHISSLPNTMTLSLGTTTTSSSFLWRGSDNHELCDQFLEPVKWKSFSNVCTAAVKHDPSWLQGDSSGVYIVTGAQLFRRYFTYVFSLPTYLIAPSERQSGAVHQKVLASQISSQI